MHPWKHTRILGNYNAPTQIPSIHGNYIANTQTHSILGNYNAPTQTHSNPWELQFTHINTLESLETTMHLFTRSLGTTINALTQTHPSPWGTKMHPRKYTWILKNFILPTQTYSNPLELQCTHTQTHTHTNSYTHPLLNGMGTWSLKLHPHFGSEYP